MEIHVAEIGVLRDMKADGDRRRIAVADFEIDVAHRRIECAALASAMSSFGGTVPGGGNGTRLPERRIAAGRAPVNITMTPTPVWKPGVLSASTKTGRVAP